jgi:hypothetical protein
MPRVPIGDTDPGTGIPGGLANGKRGMWCRLIESYQTGRLSGEGQEGAMKLRVVLALLTLFIGLASGPAWAFWGGVDSISDRIDALVTIEVLPLNAEVRLNGARLGTALEISSQGLAIFGQRVYTVTVTAPGFIPRTLTLVANSSMPQRVFVDLVPIRTP